MAVDPQPPPGDNMSLPAASSEEADEKMTGTKPEQSGVRDDVHDVHNPATAIPEGDGAGPMPSKMSFILIIAGLCLAVFLVAIDNTIVATAIPRIADEFGALDKVGWYGAAYVMTMCATQLPFGKLYTLYPVKTVFLCAIAVFEIGSVVCGAAPTSNALIAGRAVAGVGGAGVFQGAMVIIPYIVPVRSRPAYNGMFGAIYGVSSVIGPLLGGAFVDRVHWRWCFYINLPIGGATIVAVAFILKIPGQVRVVGGHWKEQVARLDPLGSLLFLPAIVCLLLALQWGGSEYAWGSGTIIALFVLSGVLFAGFMGVQVWVKENATIPLRVARLRTTITASVFSLFLLASYLGMIFYLPIWFQAIQEVSAVDSGLRCLPSMLGVVVFSIISGGSVKALNRYVPLALASSTLTAIGAGLMTTFTVDEPSSRWIGYQVIFGAGVGLGVQIGVVAVQTRLGMQDIAVGIAIVSFFQYLGGTVSLAVYQGVFNNMFISKLTELAPDAVATFQQGVGATDLRRVIDPADYEGVRQAYHESLTRSWFIFVGLAAASGLGALAMEWKPILAKEPADGADNADGQTPDKAA